MFFIYRLLTALLYPIYRFIVLPYRLRTQKEDIEHYKEKLGFASQERGNQKLVWFHAVSVGESLSIVNFVERLLKEYPNWQVLLTSSTVTSARIIQKRFPDQIIYQYAPLDFVCSIDRFLNHWQPDLMIWVESELWPNIIQKAHKRNIPLILLNMRLSQRSFKKWIVFKNTFLKMIGAFRLILTQTEELNTNLQTIGYKRSLFCGNLKCTGTPAPFSNDTLKALQNSLSDRVCWMAVSTHDPEEIIMLQAHKQLLETTPNMCLLLAVRHPHRYDEIEHLIKREGLTVQRYSAWQQSPDIIRANILLINQMGGTSLFYELAPYVFVGGSIPARIGGHNILEPLRQNCITLHGPHMKNFKEIAKETSKQGITLEVKTPEDISDIISHFMRNPQEIEMTLQKRKTFLKQQEQVLDQIFNEISPYLEQEDMRERA